MTSLRLLALISVPPLALASCADLLGIKDADLQMGPAAGTSNGSGDGSGFGSSTGVGVGSSSASGGSAQGGMTTGIATAPSCGVKYNSECLQTCADARCCIEQQNCIGDVQCGKLLDCADACESASTDNCLAQCQEKYSAGYSLLTTLQTCQRTQCSLCPGPLTDNAIVAFAQAECSKYKACDPVAFSESFGETNECVTRNATFNRWVYSLPDVDWAASAFNACAKTFAAMSCSDYLNGVRADACNVPGKVENGKPCNDSAQCLTSFCSNDLLSCGTCVSAPTESAACINGKCAAGFVCASDSTCQYPGRLGDPCAGDRPCQSTLTCYQDQCVEASAIAGATCDVAAGLFCDLRASLACNSATKQCATIALKYPSSGQKCGVDAGGAAICSSGHCQAGKCVALAKDHTPCDEQNGPECEWPAKCVFGICRLGSDVASCGSIQ